MKVKVHVEGIVLGLQTTKYAERLSHKLKVLQGMELVSIFVPSEVLAEVASIPQNTKAIVVAEVWAYRDKNGFYLRFLSVLE